MAKTGKQAYRCAECGWQTSKWVGRCGECQAWGTVDVAGAAKPARVVTAGPVSAPARPIGEVDVQAAQTTATGLDELDRVLGGGLVPGAVMLLMRRAGHRQVDPAARGRGAARRARPGALRHR